MKGFVTGWLLTVLWNKISANSHIYSLFFTNLNAVNAVKICEGDARNSCLEKEAHLFFFIQSATVRGHSRSSSSQISRTRCKGPFSSCARHLVNAWWVVVILERGFGSNDYWWLPRHFKRGVGGFVCLCVCLCVCWAERLIRFKPTSQCNRTFFLFFFYLLLLLTGDQ